MAVNARTATAVDFDASAQRWANQFWSWLFVTFLVAYFGGWFALIPGIFAVLSAVKSIGSTMAGTQLRKGTYPIPNFNNGAPDGDIRNTKIT